MIDHCYSCTESKTLTLEHVIPQSIGGRLEAELYCETCNTTFGQVLDSEIAKQFGRIGTLLNIKRERGEPQPYEVKEVKSGRVLVFDGKGFQRKDPIVKRTSADGKKLDFADITARSEAELKSICASLQRRYEVSGAIKTFTDVLPSPTEVEFGITIDNDLLRRGVTKIAYGFSCMKLPKEMILSPPFQGVRRYIKSGGEPALAAANYAHTKFMTDYIRPLHKVHLALNRDDGIIVGYVSLFGIFRFTVLLAEGFRSKLTWAGLDYTFDPVRREQVFGNDNFSAPPISRENVLHPRHSKELVQAELHRGYKAIENYVASYKFLGGELG